MNGSAPNRYARTMRVNHNSAAALAVYSAVGRRRTEASDAPRRVVSFNLCADQLVVALADPEQIAGLSPYAADSALSVVADKARAFRKLDWQAESTLAAAARPGADRAKRPLGDAAHAGLAGSAGGREPVLSAISTRRDSRSARWRRCSATRNAAKSCSPISSARVRASLRPSHARRRHRVGGRARRLYPGAVESRGDIAVGSRAEAAGRRARWLWRVHSAGEAFWC